jgi:hypothetical protein
VRNLADAIVVFETQWKLRYAGDAPALQLLIDARATLGLLKAKVRFTVNKCLRKHPQLLSSSQASPYQEGTRPRTAALFTPRLFTPLLPRPPSSRRATPPSSCSPTLRSSTSSRR